MKGICRVPLQVLSLRLSILYLRTCVGLGYGKISYNLFSWSFVPPPLFPSLALQLGKEMGEDMGEWTVKRKGRSLLYSSDPARWLVSLEAVINFSKFNLKLKTLSYSANSIIGIFYVTHVSIIYSGMSIYLVMKHYSFLQSECSTIRFYSFLFLNGKQNNKKAWFR